MLFCISIDGMLILVAISLVALVLSYFIFAPTKAEREAIHKSQSKSSRAPLIVPRPKVEEKAQVASLQAVQAGRRFVQEVVTVSTKYGPLQITIMRSSQFCRRTFLTYHDVGMDHHACFSSFFELALRDKRFSSDGICVYHVDAPGHSLTAPPLNKKYVYPSIEDLACQLKEALQSLKTGPLIFFGVGCGSRILLELACKEPDLAEALVLVSPTSNEAGIVERTAGALLGYFGPWLKRNYSSLIGRLVVARHFSSNMRNRSSMKLVLGGVRSCVAELPVDSVVKMWRAFAVREPLDAYQLDVLQDLRMLLIVGINSSFFGFGPDYFMDLLKLRKYYDPRTSTSIVLDHVGSHVLEEINTDFLDQISAYLEVFS